MANARNVRLYYPYWQYTDLFIFRFVYIIIVVLLTKFHLWEQQQLPMRALGQCGGIVGSLFGSKPYLIANDKLSNRSQRAFGNINIFHTPTM